MLESDDIALTNHVLVGECLSALLPERTDLPDEIYLVETEVKSWTVHCMKLGYRALARGALGRAGDVRCGRGTGLVWRSRTGSIQPVFRATCERRADDRSIGRLRSGCAGHIFGE